MAEGGSPTFNKVCRYFQRGTCTYGAQCRFVHPVTVTPTYSVSRAAGANRGETERSCGTTNFLPPKNWADAPEFVPLSVASAVAGAASSKSFAEVVQPIGGGGEPQQVALTEPCELCGQSVRVGDEQQRKRHLSCCVAQYQHQTELSIGLARSQGKTCGVCFETVVEKSNGQQRFGILPNCNHCFCLSCIRTWRQSTEFDREIVRGCPECRVTSDFVCPSVVWVEDAQDKAKLLSDYKGALARKHCKHFKRGGGMCPFGNECFYLHALPDGTRVTLDPPRRRRRTTADGDNEEEPLLTLWQFLRERRVPLELYDDLLSLISNESDFSSGTDFDSVFDS